LAPTDWGVDNWAPKGSFSACGKSWYAVNVKGLIFYSNDDTIKAAALAATSVKLISIANKNPKVARTLNGAISLINRASGISGNYARNGIRSAISSRVSFGLVFF